MMLPLSAVSNRQSTQSRGYTLYLLLGMMGVACSGEGPIGSDENSSGGSSSGGAPSENPTASGGSGEGPMSSGGDQNAPELATGGTTSSGGASNPGSGGEGLGSGGDGPSSGGADSSAAGGGDSDPDPDVELGTLIGFATLNGGTTGGAMGQLVSATNYNELKNYAESSTAYVIMIQGEITNGSSGGQIRIKSNKSLIGAGSNAFLNGVALDINNQNNIIIQNLKLTLVGTSSPSSINGGDVIGISGTASNIWVDHCELYSEDPSIQTDKDKYDGLIDIKGQTGFITLSWNYLHDHHKGGLVGAADDDLFNDRKVTMHHNYYKNVKLRVPMYRGSTGHFFNNYIVDAQDATEIRAGSCVRVEKNYYEALHYSIYTPSDAKGSTERIDNIEVDRTSRAYPANCNADIPYEYASVLTSNTSEVKTIVPSGAGIGKL